MVVEDWVQVWQYGDGYYNYMFDEFTIRDCLKNIGQMVQLSGTVKAIAENERKIKVFHEIKQRNTYYIIGIWVKKNDKSS